jgi:hypothetical protein
MRKYFRQMEKQWISTVLSYWRLIVFAIRTNFNRNLKYFFCSTLSEFENFLLCERILINVTTVKTKRQANFKGF